MANAWGVPDDSLIKPVVAEVITVRLRGPGIDVHRRVTEEQVHAILRVLFPATLKEDDV